MCSMPCCQSHKTQGCNSNKVVTKDRSAISCVVSIRWRVTRRPIPPLSLANSDGSRKDTFHGEKSVGFLKQAGWSYGWLDLLRLTYINGVRTK